MIVYIVVGRRTVGVPEISPVEVSKFNPADRLGEIHQVIIGPPELVGVTATIGVSLVKSNWSGL